MGCSEAKYRHQYGCDRNKQTVSVKDKVKKQVQVSTAHNGLRIIEWAVVSLAAAYVRLETAHNIS